MDIKKLEEKIIDNLNEKKLWKHFYAIDDVDKASKDLIMRLSQMSYKFELRDDRLYAKDENGELISLPDDALGVDFSGEWFSDYIPAPAFDITQNNNVRKADEAEALYCALVVRCVLDDDDFTKDFNDLVDDYDYDIMVGSKGEKTFKKLLEDWQQFQSFVIKVVVSACKYRISKQKKDVTKFLQDGLEEEEIQGLQV